MRELILSTPWYKKDKATKTNIGAPGQSHSWETYTNINSQQALGYELYPNEYNILISEISNNKPVKVVLLRNDKCQRRAEAQLTKPDKTPRQTKRGYWRYDISFNNVQVVPYKYLPAEKVKRNGVKLI